METRIINTIDFGTQSVRCAFVDNKGNILAIEKVAYEKPYFSLKPGYAEQHANVYIDSLSICSKKLYEKNPELAKQIVGVAPTCFRDSAVMCDKNMKPVRAVFTWLDQRQAEGKEKIPFYSHLLFWLARMYPTLTLNRARTPAHWVKENEPEIWSKVKYYMNISTYINYQLIGEYKDTIANYAGHFPTDFKHCRFYKSDKHFQGCVFGIKHDMLCEIVKSGDILGYITKEASEKFSIPEGTKVFAIGSDKSCETLGLGILKPNTCALSCGTASTIEVINKKFAHPEPFLPAYPSVLNGYYNLDNQVYRGFWMLNWFSQQFADKEIQEAIKKNISVEQVLNDKLDEVPPGCNGLILQPYWGPGLSRPLSRGAIIGFSDTITKMHVYRAIIEGIDYELKRSLILIERSLKLKITDIMISGGGSQSDAVCQIAADIFDRPISRVQTFETSSLGAAIAGFLAAGVFEKPEDAVEAMVRKSDTFLPNKTNREVYDYMFKKGYMKMYPRLKYIYKDIKNYETNQNRKTLKNN